MTATAHAHPATLPPLTRRGALITGGAGGTGSAIARRLKADRFRVFITDVDSAAGDRVSNELQVDFISGDSACEAEMRRVVEHSDPVHVLVNNVGIRGGTGPLWQLPIKDFRRTLEVNTVSHVLASQLVAPAMIERRSGLIIIIACGAARTGSVGPSPYGISKWALLGLTKSLANELAPWAVSHFSSDDAVGITGTFLDVTGGFE
jgi:NAD(P)-dependent dehydrogenase (short-subunit alcohol dehydrogenase family)